MVVCGGGLCSNEVHMFVVELWKNIRSRWNSLVILDLRLVMAL
jgi:hypothetical protein